MNSKILSTSTNAIAESVRKERDKAILFAIQSEDLEELSSLCEDPNALRQGCCCVPPLSPHKLPPLAFAAFEGRLNVCEWLVGLGASIDDQDKQLDPTCHHHFPPAPLEAAAFSGQIDVCRWLAAKGAATGSGAAAIVHAARNRNFEIFELCLEVAGPEEALYRATTQGYLAGCELAIAKGASIDCKRFDTSMLGWAVRVASVTVVQHLIASGAKLDGGLLCNTSYCAGGFVPSPDMMIHPEIAAIVLENLEFLSEPHADHALLICTAYDSVCMAQQLLRMIPIEKMERRAKSRKAKHVAAFLRSFRARNLVLENALARRSR